MARGRDGLYRRDGVFAFRYKGHDGHWREKYTGTSDRQDAREFRERFLQELKAGCVPNAMADWRLDAAESWWIEFRQPRVAEKTLNSERYRLQHLRLVLGNKRLRELTNRDLDDYVTARLAGYNFQRDGQQRRRPAVAAWSINKEILLWSLLLRKAKLWRRLEDDYKPLPTRASDIGRALSRGELRHLADVASKRKDWEAAFFGSVLAVNTGLRGGEIKKLRIGALDLERRRLKIVRADAKSDASARWVELNADATEAAARLVMRARELGAIASEHYLMPKHLSRIAHGPGKGARGHDPLQHQTVWDSAWTSLTSAVRCPKCDLIQSPGAKCRAEKCGADIQTVKSATHGLRFHDLRHSFITAMVERGIPLGVIQSMVGHISGRMLRHYTHVSSGAARRAVEALDAEPMLAPVLSGAVPAPPSAVAQPLRESRVYRA